MPKGIHENSQANLVQNRSFTAEQRREWAAMGGRARGEQLHRQKLQRDIFKEMLFLDCDDEQLCGELEKLGLDTTFAGAMNLAVLRRALRGDIECVRYIRDTLGEKPTESMQLGVFNTPVKALDMTKLSDAELEALADRADSGE